MIGTEYEESPAGPDSWKVTEETIHKMMEEVNAIYPPARLQYSDISFYHAGLLPMQGISGLNNIQLEKNSTIIEHTENGMEGILSVKGVKYTTAPHIAGEVVKLLGKRLQATYHAAERKNSPAIPGPVDSRVSDLQDLFAERYGTRAGHVLSYLKEVESGDVWIDRTARLSVAEVHYLVVEEMASTLSDIVFRRTGLGDAECPPREVLVKTAAEMGKILAWEKDRVEREVEKVLGHYDPLIRRGT